MADNHGDGNGFLGPVVPVVDMQVRTTNPCAVHLNEDIVDADFRFRDIFKPKAGSCVSFYECLHGV